MYATHNKSPADKEVIKVLTTISHVSARLARKLPALATQSQSEEGGKHHEQKVIWQCNHKFDGQKCATPSAHIPSIPQKWFP